MNRVLRSLRFRTDRWIYGDPYRPDLIRPHNIRRWLKKQSRPMIAPDLEIRGRSDALSRIVLGDRVAVDRGCTFWLSAEEGADASLSLGDRVYLGPNTYLGAFQSISIGANCLIGANSYLISGNHQSRPGIPVREQGYTGDPIVLGDDVWLGASVVILPGVQIGTGSIIGAGAVVTKSVPAGEVWGGVPAKKIRNRE